VTSPQELLTRNGIAYVATRKGKFTTKCPSCGGGYLNVEEKRDGVVWFCRACQAGGGEQYEPNGNGVSGGSSGLGPIKATFDYHNEAGEQLFQVLKFEPLNGPKQFRQRTSPDQTPWSIKGVRIVPYRLPEMIEAIAAEHVVFVVEGEKDVETLRARGIPATCSPMGAGKWWPWFNEMFKDGDIVICGDNDGPGRDHVKLVVNNLRSVARRLRVLDLKKFWPEIEESDDITDWFDAGGTVERVWEFVEQLPTSDDDGRAQFQERGNGKSAEADIRIEDFVAYMPMHSYIFKPTREMWPAASVNARISPPIGVDKATLWLDQNAPVEQMTWAPGEPMLITGRLVADGGWIERKGMTCFNLYRSPTIVPGDASKAGPWLDHVHKIYPKDADHIIAWLAHRVQRPAEKINHALVLGGLQGIGKDTLLEPAKRAVGPWNVHEVSPQHMLGRFNGYLKSVILRVNEARDLGDVDRFSFYDHLKAYTATPPDVLRVDEKNLREYSVLNCCGVIITTNHKADGIYLPADDRRHYVAWSDLTKDDFHSTYWIELWNWYNSGGDRHVAAYLAALDISRFDPKAPPPKTTAFWTIVDASRAPEDGELADVLDRLGNPDATTLMQVQNMASGDFQSWIMDRRNRRQIPYRFEQCRYVPVRNDAADDGLWKIGGRRQVVYAKSTLSLHDRIKAARGL